MFADVGPRASDELARYGLLEAIGPDAILPSVGDAIDAFEARQPSAR